MNLNDTSKKNVEISKFQKVLQLLIVILFVPVLLISVFSIYIYSSTKSNSGLPSGFGLHVVEVPEEIDAFNAGQIIVVKDADTSSIKVNDYVAFYVASEEPDASGSLVAFKKVLEIIEDNGLKRFRFANEMYYQIEGAIIGVYSGSSAFTIGLLTFFSSNLVIIFMALVPLLFILILLGLYIIEQFSVTRLNKDIKLALSKAESAGFDTNIGANYEIEKNAEIAQKSPSENDPITAPKVALPPKKAPVAHVKARIPQKAPVNIQSVQENVLKPEQPKSAETVKPTSPPLPPKKHPKQELPQKASPALPPKKAPATQLPPKKDK